MLKRDRKSCLRECIRQVKAPRRTDCDGPSILVHVTLTTGNLIVCHKGFQQSLCLLSAGPCFPVPCAGLCLFRRINAEKADALAAEIQGVAINRERPAVHDLGLDGGGDEAQEYGQKP